MGCCCSTATIENANTEQQQLLSSKKNSTETRIAKISSKDKLTTKSTTFKSFELNYNSFDETTNEIAGDFGGQTSELFAFDKVSDIKNIKKTLDISEIIDDNSAFNLSNNIITSSKKQNTKVFYALKNEKLHLSLIIKYWLRKYKVIEYYRNNNCNEIEFDGNCMLVMAFYDNTYDFYQSDLIIDEYTTMILGNNEDFFAHLDNTQYNNLWFYNIIIKRNGKLVSNKYNCKTNNGGLLTINALNKIIVHKDASIDMSGCGYYDSKNDLCFQQINQVSDLFLGNGGSQIEKISNNSYTLHYGGRGGGSININCKILENYGDINVNGTKMEIDNEDQNNLITNGEWPEWIDKKKFKGKKKKIKFDISSNGKGGSMLLNINKKYINYGNILANDDGIIVINYKNNKIEYVGNAKQTN